MLQESPNKNKLCNGPAIPLTGTLCMVGCHSCDCYSVRHPNRDHDFDNHSYGSVAGWGQGPTCSHSSPAQLQQDMVDPKPEILNSFLVFAASREHALGEGSAGPTTQELRSGQMLILTVRPLSLRVSGLGCEPPEP